MEVVSSWCISFLVEINVETNIYKPKSFTYLWGCFHMCSFCNIWISFDMSLSCFAFIYGGNVHNSSFCFLSGLSPSLQEPCHSVITVTWWPPSAFSGSSTSKLLICAFLAHCVTSELKNKNKKKKLPRYILFKKNQKSIGFRVGKMTQWIKIPGGLSSISGTCIRSGRRKPDSTKDILWPPHGRYVIWGHVHRVNKWINRWIFVDHYKLYKSM